MVPPSILSTHDLDGQTADLPRMTEDEFVKWVFGAPEDVRAEWVNGEVIIMSPASFRHVEIGNWLTQVLGIYVRAKQLGKLVGPEFMVRLRHAGVSRRIPDLLFISQARLIHVRKNHLEGPPDLAIEVVSPDSVVRDRREKFNEYEAAGVAEYWVIDPEAAKMEAWVRNPAGTFIPTEIQPDGSLHAATVPGYWIKPDWLWQAELPDPLDSLRLLGVL